MQYALNQQTIGKLSIVGRGTEKTRLEAIGIETAADIGRMISGPNKSKIRKEILNLLKRWGVEL